MYIIACNRCKYTFMVLNLLALLVKLASGLWSVTVHVSCTFWQFYTCLIWFASPFCDIAQDLMARTWLALPRHTMLIRRSAAEWLLALRWAAGLILSSCLLAPPWVHGSLTVKSDSITTWAVLTPEREGLLCNPLQSVFIHSSLEKWLWDPASKTLVSMCCCGDLNLLTVCS